MTTNPLTCLQEMSRLEQLINELNAGLYNPVGLRIRWPRDVAFMFVSAPPIYISPVSPSPYLPSLSAILTDFSPSTLQLEIEYY